MPAAHVFASVCPLVHFGSVITEPKRTSVGYQTEKVNDDRKSQKALDPLVQRSPRLCIASPLIPPGNYYALVVFYESWHLIYTLIVYCMHLYLKIVLGIV